MKVFKSTRFHSRASALAIIILLECCFWVGSMSAQYFKTLSYPAQVVGKKTPISTFGTKVYQLLPDSSVVIAIDTASGNVVQRFSVVPTTGGGRKVRSDDEIQNLSPNTPIDIKVFDGEIVVLTYPDQVRGYTSTGSLAYSIPALQFGQTSEFSFIADDKKGRSFIMDKQNSRILQFKGSSTSNYAFSYASALTNGELRGFDAYDNFVYLMFDQNLVKMDTTGTVLLTAPRQNSGNWKYAALHIDSRGRILASEIDTVSFSTLISQTIYTFPAGLQSLTNSNPSNPLSSLNLSQQTSNNVEVNIGHDLSVGGNGQVYLAARNSRRIKVSRKIKEKPILRLSDYSKTFRWANDSTKFSKVFKRSDFPTGAEFLDYNGDTLQTIQISNFATNQFFRVYYDSLGDGFSSADLLTSQDVNQLIPITHIYQGKLKIVCVAEPTQSLITSNTGQITVRYSDGGLTTSETQNFNFQVLATAVDLNGTAGSGGNWHLITNPYQKLSLSEFLDPIWTQGAVGSDFPSGSPNVFTYDPTSAEFSPITNFTTDSLGRGDAIAVYVYEDDDPNISGVQGGYPKRLNTKVVLDQNSNQPILLTGDFTKNLTYSQTSSNTSLHGWNLVGMPVAASIQWMLSSPASPITSRQIAVWSPNANNGNGGYLYWNGVTGSLGSSEIKPFQAFWARAQGNNASITFNSGLVSGNASLQKEDVRDEIIFQLDHQNFHDELYLTIYSQPTNELGFKLPNLTSSYHELFGVTNDDPKSEPQSIISTGEQMEPVEIKVRSTILPQATISLGKSTTVERAELEYHIDGNVEKYWVSKSDSAHFQLIEVGDEFVLPGKLYYTGPKHATHNDDDEIPTSFALDTYPNPFNPTTTVRVSLESMSTVRIDIYNMIGEKISELVNGQTMSAGVHQFTVDANNWASGMYIIRASVNGRTTTKKLTLLK